MTKTYLVLCLLSLLLTVNALRPVYRRPILAMFSFVFGWLVSELTLQLLVVQVLGTLLFVWGGAVVGLPGALGLTLSLVSWAGMAYLFFDALKTGVRTEASLETSLGDDYVASIDPALLEKIPLELDGKRLLKPFSPHLPDVQCIKDIVYGSEDGTDLKLDIYRHESPLENAPVLLQIHGGGWTEKMGDKNHQALPLMNELARMGWVCVSVDYRLSPTSSWPAHIIDCKLGLKWIREHVEEYGGNPDFIIATGGSAGGHLSSLLALTANDPDFQPGFEDVDTSVDACVPFYGVYDLTDANNAHHNSGLVDYVQETVFKRDLEEERGTFEAASPLHRVHEDAPPFFVIHGEKDSLISVVEADRFVERLRSVSQQSVVYHSLPYTQHAFDIFRSPRSEYLMFGVLRYVNYIYSRYLESRA
ncbi:MAG: alpha/beta hydrolase [Gammaproteobacteria bacterium]|nr:alpha/beta hydrolase [Gammaproteobacteria bacterium]